MQRTQLNININPGLLASLKETAKIEGKTVTSYISEVLSITVKNQGRKPLTDKVDTLEKKISFLEVKINALVSPQRKITPFTEEESENCSKFMRSVFYKQMENIKIKNRSTAFKELLDHVTCFHQWDKLYTLRLKEVLFIDDYEPFTSTELNHLTTGKECPCPIRTGIINWINNGEKGQCSCKNNSFPSQQDICNSGQKLVANLF